MRRTEKKKNVDVRWISLAQEEAIDEIKDFVDNWADMGPDALLNLYRFTVDASARLVETPDGNSYTIEYAVDQDGGPVDEQTARQLVGA